VYDGLGVNFSPQMRLGWFSFSSADEARIRWGNDFLQSRPANQHAIVALTICRGHAMSFFSGSWDRRSGVAR